MAKKTPTTIDAEVVDKIPEERLRPGDVERIEPSASLTRLPATELTPAQMLSTGVSMNYPPAVIEKLMDINDRWEATKAKKAYVAAVSKFKKDPPKVAKDMTNTQYDSRYTSKDELINTVNPALSKCGLSARFDYSQEPELITVSCILTHNQGHSETVSLSAPPDTSGAKNVIQQIKSTITYLEIVTFSGVTGISSSEANDDDGNGSKIPDEGDEFLSEEQVNIMSAMLDENNLDQAAFLKFINKASIVSIKATSYEWCVEQIEFVIKRHKANAEKVAK